MGLTMVRMEYLLPAIHIQLMAFGLNTSLGIWTLD